MGERANCGGEMKGRSYGTSTDTGTSISPDTGRIGSLL
jgi:hypothetical protein